ncbi:hypothetical protein [Burkholderia phage BCSR5]|nr:hypothetical protein [Burkholderia phage BCSR5]
MIVWENQKPRPETATLARFFEDAHPEISVITVDHYYNDRWFRVRDWECILLKSISNQVTARILLDFENEEVFVSFVAAHPATRNTRVACMDDLLSHLRCARVIG